jgi:hypothetical protein
MGYLRRKEGRKGGDLGDLISMLPILPRVFGQFLFEVGGKNVILTCKWVKGGSPSFFGLFLFFFCAVQSKRTSQDTKHYLTNFAGVSAQEEPPSATKPAHKLHRVISPTQTHKQTNKESNLQKELEAGLFLGFIF